MAAGLWLGLGPMGLIVAGSTARHSRKPTEEPRTEGTPAVSGAGANPLTAGVPSARGSSHPPAVGQGVFNTFGDPLAFARLSVGLFVAAVVGVYLTLPIYSCAKASYLLSTLPCVAVLAAAGWDRVVAGRRVRAVAVGLLACWAVASFLAYVVTG